MYTWPLYKDARILQKGRRPGHTANDPCKLREGQTTGQQPRHGSSNNAGMAYWHDAPWLCGMKFHALHAVRPLREHLLQAGKAKSSRGAGAGRQWAGLAAGGSTEPQHLQQRSAGAPPRVPACAIGDPSPSCLYVQPQRLQGQAGAISGGWSGCEIGASRRLRQRQANER